MKYDPQIHHRRSIRLKGYDYARAGAYFVKVVTQWRLCLYGEIGLGEMGLNAAGQMVEKWWIELVNKFPAVEVDAYVVMPNHFHGIIVIADQTGVGAPVSAAMATKPAAALPAVMQWFKTMTTNEYIEGVKTLRWTPFPGKLWQRNYHEHIVRNEEDLTRIRRYIDNNPQQWELDTENPEQWR